MIRTRVLPDTLPTVENLSVFESLAPIPGRVAERPEEYGPSMDDQGRCRMRRNRVARLAGSGDDREG